MSAAALRSCLAWRAEVLICAGRLWERAPAVIDALSVAWIDYRRRGPSCHSAVDPNIRIHPTGCRRAVAIPGCGTQQEAVYTIEANRVL